MEDERVAVFKSEKDDIDCPYYDSMLAKFYLTDHINEYLERRYEKYGIKKKPVI